MTHRTAVRALAPIALLASILLTLQGCILPQLVSAIGQNIEREKKIEVLAKYTGLDNKSVAVLVHCDMGMLYEYPMVKPNMVSNISARIHQYVSGARVLPPAHVMSWEYQTPTWASMPMGAVCESLLVDRVVYVDVYEFRLNPPGNRYLWEAAAVANVSVFERDSIDPDSPADTFSVTAKFPDENTVTRETLKQEQVEAGITGRFCQSIVWIFTDHIEDKYPDRPLKGH